MFKLKKGSLIACTLVSLASFWNSTVFSQQTATPPLDVPRIERVQKPWTAAEAAILAPRERDGAIV